MKKFFMCCVVIIVALFLGFTIYYIASNKEKITLATDSNSIKLNVGETLNMSDLITHTMPHEGTTIKISYSVEGVLTYNEENKLFTANQIGSTVITLTPSNIKFGPFVFNAVVGDGSCSEYPYFIKTEDELKAIGAIGSKLTTSMCYELLNDMYLKDTPWTPIGLYSGVFNGGNHAIYNLTVAETENENCGMFRVIDQVGVVKNLTFVEANISGSFTNCGVVAGTNHGTVALCRVVDSTLNNGATGGFTGGIVGTNSFKTTFNANGVAVGGVSARVGMCGVENSNIVASGNIGGIAGENYASVIENCYANLASVEGNSTAKFGGVVAMNTACAISVNGSSDKNFAKPSTIYKCHAEAVTSNVSAVCGIAYKDSAGVVSTDTTIENAYIYNIFAIDTQNFVGAENNYSADQIVKVETSQLATQGCYATWDFAKVWTMGKNYAVINYTNPYITCVSDTSYIEKVIDYDPEDPEPTPTPVVSNLIYNVDTFKSAMTRMKETPNSGEVYYITASFDVTSVDMNSLSFPLSTSRTTPFTCQIYANTGCEVTIKNFSNSSATYASMFGFVGSGAVISGFVYNDASISATNTNAGVVCGEISTGASVYACTVKNSSVTGSGNIGCIAGVNYGSIKNCDFNSNTITVQASGNAGAVVGQNSGNISSCNAISACTVTANGASGNFGGVAGSNAGYINTISLTSTKITTTASSVLVGGVAGINNGNIVDVVSTDAQITASTSFETAYVGGIAGQNSGTINGAESLNAKVVGCYAGGIAGLNTSYITCSTAGQNNLGSVSGVYAGGLVAVNQSATISDCVVGTQMVASSYSQYTCGFAYKLEGSSSLITHCFTYAKFSGSTGYLRCDTDTAFRNVWSGIWQMLPGTYEMGKIENSLMYNQSNVTIYGNGLIPDSWDASLNDLQVSASEAKGEGNWEKFYANCFDFNVWLFVTGQYPSIR